MSEPRIVTSSADISAGLRHPDLRQALYDDGAVVMGDTLLTLSGERHRKRRLLEFGVFRKDFFHWYEQHVFPLSLGSVLKPLRARDGCDLVDFSAKATMNLTADFAGIDRPDQNAAETAQLLELVATFSEGATMVHTMRAPEVVRAEVRAALDRFAPAFLEPSIARRRDLLGAVAKEEMSADALPRDVLTALLQYGDPEDLTPQVLTREIAFFLQAGSHSSATAVVHAFHEIVSWAGEDAIRWAQLQSDPFLLQRCVHESLRLHPASPVAWRAALCPLHLPGAGALETGETVEFRLAKANRDPALFGDDAEAFNPMRMPAGSTPPYGHTFGTGVHSCLGRDLAGGAMPKADTDPARHKYGIITLILRALFQRGARPDPSHPARMTTHSTRKNWGCYPIVFRKEYIWT